MRTGYRAERLTAVDARPMVCPHCKASVQPGNARGRHGHIAECGKIVARYRCRACDYHWFLMAQGLVCWDWPSRPERPEFNRRNGASVPLVEPDELCARVNLARQAAELYPCASTNPEFAMTRNGTGSRLLRKIEKGAEADGEHLGRMATARGDRSPTGSRAFSRGEELDEFLAQDTTFPHSYGGVRA